VLGLGVLTLFAAGAAFTFIRDQGSQRQRTASSVYCGSEPPPGIHMPGFRLRSYRGSAVSSAGLRGKVVLVTFLDTACTESCPIIAASIEPLYRSDDRGASWVPVT
jgi:cytochrome oxidase Cu insertion factor (SCO1/SenC/PrrC family)